MNRQAEEALRELDCMKSEFISNVSHDLCSPLHSIKGFTKLMLGDEVPDSETQEEFPGIVIPEEAMYTSLKDFIEPRTRWQGVKWG